MTVCTDIADYEWLTGDEARAVLDELAEDAGPLHKTVERLRGRMSPGRAHHVMEQVELRRRAAAKFSEAGRMFFTRLGLEQATDEWIAAYKARRFAALRAGASAAPAIADLCCGIGGDLLALAGQGVGIDCDPIAAHFARANTGGRVLTADAIEMDLQDFAAWHIDPDRRAGGARTTSLEHVRPGRGAIERLLAQRPHAAAKLAPATRVPDAWARSCELEWISRDRECRQLVAWHGDLARSPGQRRATIVPTGCGLAPRTMTGTADQPIEVVERCDRYIFDVDPAIVAARLQGALAAEHCLAALGPGPTYLTGPDPIHDPALGCFEVADVLPLQLRRLTSYLRQRGIGRLEIKKRGVAIDPAKLRRELKLRGESAATVLITQISGRTAAIVAHRRSGASAPSVLSARSVVTSERCDSMMRENIER